MNFDLTDEQTMLQSTVRRFIDTSYSFERRRQIQASADGFSRAHWSQFADLGLLAIPFSEDDGGVGGNAVDMAIVMSELGRGLVLEPFLSTVVLAGGLLRHAGTKSQKQALIPAIASGQCICAFAYAEDGSRYNLADIRLSARTQDEGYVLNGAKIAVYAAPAADWIFVTARTAGARRDAEGITVFRIRADSPGLLRHDYVTIDGARASDLTFENVRASSEDVVGSVDGGLPVTLRVAEEAIVALCAEAVGAMAALNEITVEYTRQRRAFGQTISRFQVIRHRLVNMRIAAEQAHALAMGAAFALGGSEERRAALVAAAKAKIGKESRLVAQGAVQLHGGIGTTDELIVGHYMKRLMAVEMLFGDTAHHLQRFADIGDKIS